MLKSLYNVWYVLERHIELTLIGALEKLITLSRNREETKTTNLIK